MDIALYFGLVAVIITYLLSAALVFTSKTTGTLKTLFFTTFLATALWGGGYLLATTTFTSNPFIIWPFLETILIVAWTLLLLAMLDTSKSRIRDFLATRYVIAIILAATLFNFFITYAPIDGTTKFKLLISVNLLGAIVQLILLEQVYRSAGQEKWGYKPLILGLACVNIYHIVMMSNALLLTSLDPQFAVSRPYIFVLMAPLLLLSMKRIQSWSLRIFISRDIVLQSALLMFAGAYLLLMSITGYFLQQIGEVWSGVAQTVFITGALMMLVYIFISDSIRKHFKIFIQKHFYANQFDYREQWLQLTKTLDSAKEDDDFYEVSLNGICQSINYQKGSYYKLKTDGLEVVTKDYFCLNDAALSELQHISTKLAQNHWLIDITEFGSSSYANEFRGYPSNHLVMFEVEIIVPIFIHDKLHGLFALSSTGSEKQTLNWEVRDYLRAIGSQISSYIRFGEARLKLEENAKFAAFNRMSAFVVHDLKNVIAQIGMIVKNAEKHRNNPEFIDDTFETLGHTKERMDRMLAQLKEKQQQRGHQAVVELTALLKKLSVDFKRNQPNVTLTLPPHQSHLTVDYDRFYSIIGHLVENAQHATDDNGEVTLTLEDHFDNLKLIISDTGVGMTADFMNNQLFKPFETTKGNAGMGVGVYEAKSYVEELGGSLTVNSEVGVGSTFVITIPKKED